jgi:hypothetical protein
MKLLPALIPSTTFCESKLDYTIGMLLFKDGIYDMKKREFTKGFNRDLCFAGRINRPFPERNEELIAKLNKQLFEDPFDKMEHDFGKVKVDTDNKTVFYVTNTGKKPLIIEGVSASCGCTTPTKPEQAIQPGKKDKIEVVFHPKPGQLKEQSKTVTVTANTDPKMVVLNIKAFVEEK